MQGATSLAKPLEHDGILSMEPALDTPGAEGCVVGAEKRIALVARDIVEHFEHRLEALDGKAMVVCMSRRICIDLYRALARLRPDWQGDGDDVGALKVVMTGAASDPLDWQPHIRNKPRREALATRFRDPGDPLRVVLVRDPGHPAALESHRVPRARRRRRTRGPPAPQCRTPPHRRPPRPL